ncbi:hypothetical protein IBB82_07950 [Listeria seeligeri]|nr:hypothetical protein [Listeria seeligeri]
MLKIDNKNTNLDYDELFLEKDQLKGTMYLEFKYHTAKKEFWNEDSYYIYLGDFEVFLATFEKSKADFCMFGENDFSFDELKRLIKNLKKIDLEKISNNFVKDICNEKPSLEEERFTLSLFHLVRKMEVWLEKAIALGVRVVVLGV